MIPLWVMDLDRKESFPAVPQRPHCNPPEFNFSYSFSMNSSASRAHILQYLISKPELRFSQSQRPRIPSGLGPLDLLSPDNGGHTAPDSSRELLFHSSKEGHFVSLIYNIEHYPPWFPDTFAKKIRSFIVLLQVKSCLSVHHNEMVMVLTVIFRYFYVL